MNSLQFLGCLAAYVLGLIVSLMVSAVTYIVAKIRRHRHKHN